MKQFNGAIYFNSFAVEHTPKRNLKNYRKQKYYNKIHRIKSYDLIMCGYFCIGLIDFMLKGTSFLDFKDLFSPDEYEKNDKTVLKCFQ